MTDQARIEGTTVRGRRALSVPRIVIGVLTVALLVAGELMPFMVGPLGKDRDVAVSAFNATALLDHDDVEQMIRVGFIGLLIVVALSVIVVLLVMFAERVSVLLRVIGIVLGIVVAIGSCVVLALTAMAMNNVSATPGAGGPVLLLGTVMVAVLVGAAALGNRGTDPAGL